MGHVAIVGAGPAGLFAARKLAAQGWAVTIIDMGQDVSQRSRTVPFDLLHGVRRFGYLLRRKVNFHPEVVATYSSS
jgi:2-polyprenyl-6-methoxyphenol hydroxylase-like FAD-dependent oxidoreductase